MPVKSGPGRGARSAARGFLEPSPSPVLRLVIDSACHDQLQGQLWWH